MRVHKRKKNTRIRGSKTAGWGFRQKHKGHGSKGGVGMAGSGKRADHKKQKALMSDKKGQYFGKQGLTSRGTQKKKYDKINLREIKDNYFSKGKISIDLTKHKILGEGEGFKAEIKAKSATKGAIEKMKEAGGEIILVGVKKREERAEEKKVVVKKEVIVSKEKKEEVVKREKIDGKKEEKIVKPKGNNSKKENKVVKDKKKE